MTSIRAAFYSMVAFCGTAAAAAPKACTNENLLATMKRVSDAHDLLAHKLSPRELLKENLPDHLFIAKCIRTMQGLSPVPSVAERIPALAADILGAELLSRENIFDIAESVAKSTPPTEVFKKVIVDEQAGSTLATLSRYAARGIGYVSTPTGLILTTIAVGAAVFCLYKAFSQKAKAD